MTKRAGLRCNARGPRVRRGTLMSMSQGRVGKQSGTSKFRNSNAYIHHRFSMNVFTVTYIKIFLNSIFGADAWRNFCLWTIVKINFRRVIAVYFSRVRARGDRYKKICSSAVRKNARALTYALKFYDVIHAEPQRPQLRGDAAGATNAKKYTLGYSFHKQNLPKPSSFYVYTRISENLYLRRFVPFPR